MREPSVSSVHSSVPDSEVPYRGRRKVILGRRWCRRKVRSIFRRVINADFFLDVHTEIEGWNWINEMIGDQELQEPQGSQLQTVSHPSRTVTAGQIAEDSGPGSPMATKPRYGSGFW